MNKERDYELRIEWLADYGKTENDILQDDDGKFYIITEKTEWAEVDGRDISYDAGHNRVYLPANLQF